MGLPEAKCDVCGTPLPAGAGSCLACATETGLAAEAFPKVPGFRLLKLLGRGGMGSVYLADDLSLGRKVAVKLLAQRYQGSNEARDRFLREARALAGIDHPNVLRIHSLGETEGVAYIVTEYVEGESLAQRISRGPLPAGEALRITRETSSHRTFSSIRPAG
jgi:serine/threonine-protein kinase